MVLSDDLDCWIELDLKTENMLVTRADLRAKTSKPALTTIHIVIREGSPKYSPSEKVLQCLLFSSLTTYGANITDSALRETLVDSVPLKPYDPTRNTRRSYPTATSHTLRDGVWKKCIKSETNGTAYENAPVEYHRPLRLSNGTVGYDKKAMYHSVGYAWCFGEAAQIWAQRCFYNLFRQSDAIIVRNQQWYILFYVSTPAEAKEKHDA